MKRQRQVKLADMWNKNQVGRLAQTGTDDDVNKNVNSRSRETTLLPNSSFTFNGLPSELKIVDVPKDGNCLFAALSRQLELHGTSKSTANIRQELVAFMHDSDLFKTVSTK